MVCSVCRPFTVGRSAFEAEFRTHGGFRDTKSSENFDQKHPTNTLQTVNSHICPILPTCNEADSFFFAVRCAAQGCFTSENEASVIANVQILQHEVSVLLTTL